MSPAPPSAPGSVRVIGISEDSLTIEWSEAHSHGGAPITNYVIEKREGSSGLLAAWQAVATVSARTTSYVLQYLKVGELSVITTLSDSVCVCYFIVKYNSRVWLVSRERVQ